MKKAILLLMASLLLFSLCACGHKEESIVQSPAADSNIYPSARPGDENDGGAEPAAPAEPVLPPIPSVDPDWDYCRGTWVSKPSESIADNMDSYFDSNENFLRLSHDNRGMIVLGGRYREFLYTATEDSISMKFSDNGEEWTGDIIEGEFHDISSEGLDSSYTIYELAPGGGELHYTFIKTETK